MIFLSVNTFSAFKRENWIAGPRNFMHDLEIFLCPLCLSLSLSLHPLNVTYLSSVALYVRTNQRNALDLIKRNKRRNERRRTSSQSVHA